MTVVLLPMLIRLGHCARIIAAADIMGRVCVLLAARSYGTCTSFDTEARRHAGFGFAILVLAVMNRVLYDVHPDAG